MSLLAWHHPNCSLKRGIPPFSSSSPSIPESFILKYPKWRRQDFVIFRLRGISQEKVVGFSGRKARVGGRRRERLSSKFLILLLFLLLPCMRKKDEREEKAIRFGKVNKKKTQEEVQMATERKKEENGIVEGFAFPILPPSLSIKKSVSRLLFASLSLSSSKFEIGPFPVRWRFLLVLQCTTPHFLIYISFVGVFIAFRLRASE